MARFDNLSKSASLAAINAEAGRLFEAQAQEDPEKYKDREAFNTAIWFMAGDALNQGFVSLRGMTKEQIAQGMGNAVSKWVRGERAGL